MPTLTQSTHNILQRSYSKKNVFDTTEKDTVPLLPDVVPPHSSLLWRRGAPALDDKETQTLNTTDTNETNLRKTIVVKLPQATQSKHLNREKSPNSNSCHHGSVDTGEDDNDEETDTDYDYGFESDVTTTPTDDCENSSRSSSSNELMFNDKFSGTLIKYQSHLKRKAESEAEECTGRGQCQTVAHVTNISSTDLLNVETLAIQNPFAQKYKERSFYIKSKTNNRPSRSAVQMLQKEHFPNCFNNMRTSQDQLNDRNENSNENQKTATEHRGKYQIQMKAKGIAVFGKKAGTGSDKKSPAPPNTSGYVRNSLSPRRSYQHFMNVLISQKRTNATEEKTIRELVNRESIQKYERTMSESLKPFGRPSVLRNERSSLEDQNYRNKLPLKSERESIMKQTIRLKRFVDIFDKDVLFIDGADMLTRGQSCASIRLAPAVPQVSIKPAPTYVRHLHAADTYIRPKPKYAGKQLMSDKGILPSPTKLASSNLKFTNWNKIWTTKKK